MLTGTERIGGLDEERIYRNDYKMEGVMITKELQKKPLQLNPLERIHLVEMILENLDKPDPEIEKAWVAESEARYATYRVGKIKAVSLNSVQKRLGVKMIIFPLCVLCG